MFQYYKLQRVARIPDAVQDPVTTYLHNVTSYEERYTAHGAPGRFCVPDGLRMSRNLMAFNLGFPTGFPPGSRDLSGEAGAVQDWLKQLEQDFALVMIVEYFDESLVLLRRLMCWSLKDILYKHRNQGAYTATPTSNQSVYSQNREIYRNWSRVDHALYSHFLKIFEEKVQAQGPDFHREVIYFKKLNLEIGTFCSNVSSNSSLGLRVSEPEFRVAESEWSATFTFTSGDCDLYSRRLMDLVKQQHDLRFPHVTQPKPSRPTC